MTSRNAGCRSSLQYTDMTSHFFLDSQRSKQLVYNLYHNILPIGQLKTYCSYLIHHITSLCIAGVERLAGSHVPP